MRRWLTFVSPLPLQKFSASPGLLPLQKELFELLQRSCDLEAASLEYGLSAALTTVQLARREGTIDQLLQQGATLLEMLEHQRALLEEHSVPLPTDLSLQYQEAAAQQRKLALQATAEKQLPLVSKVSTAVHILDYHPLGLREVEESVKPVFTEPRVPGLSCQCSEL